MPRPKTNKLYRTFSKGLITEAGFLTYPENASIDELNTVIKTKGSRSRRFGIDWEPSSIADTLVGTSQTNVVSVYPWRNVNNDSTVNFLCVQVKGKIYFYDLDAIPVTGTRLVFTIDLTTYASPTASTGDVEGEPVQMTSGKGFLFIASRYIEPLVVEYDTSITDLVVTKIVIAVRDFDGVNDNLANEIQPSTLSKEHYYNLRNQGWVTPGPAGAVTGSQTGSNSGSAPSGTTSGEALDPYNSDGFHTRYDY